MIDHFRVLDEARRPWIESDSLKAKFLSLSALHHPDRKNGIDPSESVDYATLNVAYNCLRDVPTRLSHLLELETGEKPASVQSIPSELMDWAFQAGDLLRETDQFITVKARNTSPMIALQHFEKGMEFTDRLNAMQIRIQQSLDPLNARLQQLNPAWGALPLSAPERSALLPLIELGVIYQRYAFLSRWRNQIQERVSTLAI